MGRRRKTVLEHVSESEMSWQRVGVEEEASWQLCLIGLSVSVRPAPSRHPPAVR